jgi:hypothetical protein
VSQVITGNGTGGGRTEAVNGADRHVIGSRRTTWRVPWQPPLSLRLLGSRATKNDSRALVRSLSSFIGVCMPRAPPFCMGGAPFDPGNSLHPLSPPWLLQVDDNPLPLVCEPRTTWIPRVSVRVRPSFYLLQRTVGSKDGRRDDSGLAL